MKDLLLAHSANTPGSEVRYDGGKASISVWGAFGGGTATLEMKASDDTWVPIQDGVWLEASVRVIDIPPARLRFSVSESTNSSISAEMMGY